MADNMQSVTDANIASLVPDYEHLAQINDRDPDGPDGPVPPAKYSYENALRQQAINEVGQVLRLRNQTAGVDQALQAKQLQALKETESFRLIQALPKLRDPQKREAFMREIQRVGTDFGFSEQELAGIFDHRVQQVLYYAGLGRKAEQNSQQPPVVGVRRPASRQGPRGKRGTQMMVFQSGNGTTVQVGYINRNKQQCHGHQGTEGNLPGQFAYKMQCLEPSCRHVYGSNGCDVHLRKCPRHQCGRPGIGY